MYDLTTVKDIAGTAFDEFLNSDYGQRCWDEAHQLFPGCRNILHPDHMRAVRSLAERFADCYVIGRSRPKNFLPFRQFTPDEWNNSSPERYLSLKEAIGILIIHALI